MGDVSASDMGYPNGRLKHEERSRALAHAQKCGKCAAWVLDVERQEVSWQPDAYEIFGRPIPQFSRFGAIVEWAEPSDREAILSALEETRRTGKPLLVEYRLHWPNGELHWQEAHGSVDPEMPYLIRGTTFDVTARKRAELSLLRVEKLAAVGNIASTIAHEINNPLESVTNLIYLALADDSLPEQVRSYLATAQEELARLSNISRMTLSYARPQGGPRLVAPAEVLRNVLYLFRHRTETREVEVSVEEQTKLPVRVSVDELQRILTNLISNALDAAPEQGGRLRVSVAKSGLDVCISLEDNGSGISPEHAERIFEAFYTTKEDAGTGIGLYVTKELVERNGGTINFRSGDLPDGMRTRFDICFPAATEAGQA